MPLCALSLTSGVLSGAFVSPQNLIAAIAISVIIVCVIFLLFMRRCFFARAMIFAASVSFFLGVVLAAYTTWRVGAISVPLDNASWLICEGQVIDSPIMREWGAEADIRLSLCSEKVGLKTKAYGALRLLVGKEDADFLPGEKIRFRAKFFSAREYKNPGSFSYRTYLRVHGIAAKGRAYGPIQRLGGDNSFFARVEKLRRRIAASIESSISLPERAIITALAIGEQGGIDLELRDDFASAGLAHLLAISGLNVGYVAAFIYFVSRLIFGLWPWLLVRIPLRRLAAAITLPAVWVYVLLTGSAISAVRAALMVSVFLLGVLCWRRQDLLSMLATSVVIILILLPLSILDVSFQLSVAAVAGIIIVAPRMMEWFAGASFESWWKKMFRGIWALFVVSFVATFATQPLVAYHFKFVTIIGLVANLIAVPLSGALLSPLVAGASGAVFVSSYVASFLWKLSGLSASLLIWFTKTSADVGAPLIMRWAPSEIEMALAYAVMLVVILWRRLPYSKIIACILVISVFIDISGTWIIHKWSKEIEITVIDVGQGDSTFVRFPNGRTMLIDGGGIKGSNFDIGKSVISPLFLRMGVRHIDWILLSHPHYDHYQGLAFIAEHFSPEIIWTNGRDAPPSEEDDWQKFKDRLSAAGVALVTITEGGLSQDIGHARLHIFPDASASSGEFNDTSLVAEIFYRSKRFLFTGDLSRDGEKELARREGDLRADFLKVGHHGSADASSDLFLNAVKPKVATISLGEHNRYGMPSKFTLARLESVGADVYRTDIDGAITVTSDGSDLVVKTYVKRR